MLCRKCATKLPSMNRLLNRKYSSNVKDHHSTAVAAFSVFLFIAGAIGVKSYVSNQRSKSELKIMDSFVNLKPNAVKHVLPAVTIIDYPPVNGTKSPQTQGVVIDDEGYIVTSGVLSSELIGSKVVVRNFFTEMPGVLHSYDPSLRIGLIKLDSPRCLKSTPIDYGSVADIRMGSSVFSISAWPKGDHPSATFGHVSAVNTHHTSSLDIDNISMGRLAYIKVQVPAASGPIFCLNGKLVGFVPCGVGAGDGAEAISSQDLAFIVEQMKLHQHVQLPYFGMQLSVQRSVDGCDSSVRVDSVDENSPAQVAGIRSGDIVGAVNGRVVHTIEQALVHFGLIPGKKIQLSVHRQEKVKTSSVSSVEDVTQKEFNFEVISVPAITAQQ